MPRMPIPLCKHTGTLAAWIKKRRFGISAIFPSTRDNRAFEVDLESRAFFPAEKQLFPVPANATPHPLGRPHTQDEDKGRRTKTEQRTRKHRSAERLPRAPLPPNRTFDSTPQRSWPQFRFGRGRARLWDKQEPVRFPRSVRPRDMDAFRDACGFQTRALSRRVRCACANLPCRENSLRRGEPHGPH